MWEIRHKPETGSTNDDALAAVRAGKARAGVVFTTDEQTRGRGRAGRRWASPKGNLYASFVVDNPAKPWHLSFIAAVSAAGLAPGLECKWPNDVLLEGRKIAGILIEAEGVLAVVGIGINLNRAPTEDSAAIPGTPKETLAILGGILYNNLKMYKEFGFSPIRQEWLSKAWRLNETISVNNETGIFSGIDVNGFLILDNKRTIHTGEILNL